LKGFGYFRIAGHVIRAVKYKYADDLVLGKAAFNKKNLFTSQLELN
jgi:hypothetical protein